MKHLLTPSEYKKLTKKAKLFDKKMKALGTSHEVYGFCGAETYISVYSRDELVDLLVRENAAIMKRKNELWIEKERLHDEAVTATDQRFWKRVWLGAFAITAILLVIQFLP